jgi:hypothetical protein
MAPDSKVEALGGKDYRLGLYGLGVGQRRAQRVGVAIHGLIASKLDLHPAQPARSYGVDLRWCFQRAAALVVKILHYSARQHTCGVSNKRSVVD